MSSPMLLSWCPTVGEPDPNDPCYPCKPKPKPPPEMGLWSTSGGWYAVIEEIPNPADTGTTGTGTNVVMGNGGAIVSIPGNLTSGSDTPAWITPLWIAIERNVLYDSDPSYTGSPIGQFATSEAAKAAAAAVIANSRPIVTYPVIVAIGSGTGHPPGL